ncbi:MAG: RagB/SusD family nutrient uptake outer membrane protein [Gemmatimonadaceae bacterium]
MRFRTQYIGAVAAVIVAAACSDLTTLTQSNPAALSATTVYTPANAQLFTNGAISDFECAFSRYVVGSGLLMDELSNSFSSGSNFDYDARRNPTNASYGTGTCGSNQQPPIYTTLSVARRSTDTAVARLKEFKDSDLPTGVNRSKLIGQAYAYAGYTIVLLGEGMCTAAINVGPELTPAQIFAEAKIRFDSSIAYATTGSDPTTVSFATLGRARTQLDLGNTAAAGTDAATVPSTFVVNMSTDALNVRRENFAFITINQNSWATIDPSFRGLTINGAADPRVAVTNTGKNGTASGTQIFTPDKYPALNTVMPIARYAEAQLIVAEAKLAANDIAGATTAINAARATHPGLPAFSSAGLAASDVKTQIIEERRRELFLEGHRLGDIRRYAIPLSPAAGTAYTIGGGTYGSQNCFPLPDVEKINNPNIPKS